MAKTGNVAPQIENPIIAHNEQILIDIRSDGTNPKTVSYTHLTLPTN